MARQVMFTREVAYTIATALVCRVKQAKVETVEVNLPIETDDTARALGYMQKYMQDAENVYVSVTSLRTEKKLYGCTLDKFMSVAVELDPVTRKPLDK